MAFYLCNIQKEFWWGIFFLELKFILFVFLKCTSNIRAGIKLVILIFILQYLYASESIEWHVKKDIVIFEE